MAKRVKRVKKRKLNFLKVIIFILIIYLIIHLGIYLSNINIKNIVIKNTNYLTDAEVIKTAGLEDYPSFFRTSTNNTKEKLKKEALIEDATVKRKWGFVFEITIKEEKVLYKRKNDNVYVLGSGEEITLENNLSGVATLINYTPKNITKKLNKNLNEIDRNVLSKISEIEYAPNKTDEERFLLYMNDGNEVYITLSKADELNYYVDIVKQLNGKKGILNLDSGSYFEVME